MKDRREREEYSRRTERGRDHRAAGLSCPTGDRRSGRASEGNPECRNRDQVRRDAPVVGEQREVLLDRVDAGDQGDRDPRIANSAVADGLEQPNFEDRSVARVLLGAARVVVMTCPGIRKTEGDRRCGEAEHDADPPNKPVTAHGKEHRRRERRRNLADKFRRRDPPVYPGVCVLGAGIGEAVVEQRFECSGGKSATDPPKDEPDGETRKPWKYEPQHVAGGLKKPSASKRVAP